MIDLVALGFFGFFVVLCGWVRRSPRPARARAHLVLFLFGLLLFANLSQIDLWPFTRFIPASFKPDPYSQTKTIEFVALDENLNEHPVDLRVFSPVPGWVMEIFVVEELRHGSDDTVLMRDLLELAERGRRELARGESIGPQQWLGNAAIPFWLLHGEYEEVPDAPWVGLRVYDTYFVPVEFGGRLDRRVIDRRVLHGEIVLENAR